MSPSCNGAPFASTDVWPAQVSTRECPVNSIAWENPKLSCQLHGLTGFISIACPPYATGAGSASQTIELRILRIPRGDQLRCSHHDLRLLERRVVLHAAVEHNCAGAVAHRLDDALRRRHFLDCWAERAPRDLDLRR